MPVYVIPTNREESERVKDVLEQRSFGPKGLIPYCRIEIPDGVSLKELYHEYQSRPTSEQELDWPNWICRKGHGKLLNP
jgi:hypothetical protein